MNMCKLSLAATLMLGVSVVAVPPNVSAQDKEERPAASERAKPTEPSQQRSRSDDQERRQGKSDASERDKPQPNDRADKDDDKGERKDQRKSADRDDERSKRDDRKQQSDRKSDEPAAKKADRETVRDRKDDNADTKKPEDAPKEAAKPSDDSKKSASDDTKQGGSAKVQEAKSADLSGDKRDRVKSAFKSTNVKKITNVNIDITVGRRLPRDWEYHSIPTAVIEIVPEYRGYRYVYVEDRYVIVDPDSYEVVYVFDEGGGASVGRSTGESGSGRAGACETDLTFTTEDRRFIFEKVHTRTEATIKIGDLEIGAALPSEARVEAFPSEVTTRVSKLDSCRYVVIDDRIAVVDPDSDKIVAFIED
jgi:hypothetical protein